jgi:hypothetical protein
MSTDIGSTTARKITLKRPAVQAPDMQRSAYRQPVAPAGKPRADMVGGVASIIAAVVLVALILVQVLEWLYFDTPPSLWPSAPVSAVATQ